MTAVLLPLLLVACGQGAAESEVRSAAGPGKDQAPGLSEPSSTTATPAATATATATAEATTSTTPSGKGPPGEKPTKVARVTSPTVAPSSVTSAPVTTTTTTPVPAAPLMVDFAIRPNGLGGWLLRDDGAVTPVGDAPALGDAVGRLRGAARSLVVTPSGGGYLLVSAAGDVLAFGDAVSAGSLNAPPSSPIIGGAADPDGRGYWLVAQDSGVFAFEAPFLGSPHGISTGIVVAMEGIPGSTAYRMATSSGQVWAFRHYSEPPTEGEVLQTFPAVAPLVDLAHTPSGLGYWLTDTAGGIFVHGDATFYGSTGTLVLPTEVTAITASPTGKGYWILVGDGGLWPYGDAADFGLRRQYPLRTG